MNRRRSTAAVLGIVFTSVVLVTLAVPASGTPVADSAGQQLPSALADPQGAADACGWAPGVVGGLCDTITDVVEGGVGTLLRGGTDVVFGAMVGFVVDGAGWLLERLTTFIDSWTSPDLSSGWFRAAYGDMAVIAMLGLLPFLLLALVQALIRQDAALMLRAAFGYVPLAAIGTAGAVVVVDLLVRLTDELSAWVGRGLGADLSEFATTVGTALAKISMVTGGVEVAGLAALVAAAVIAFASFVLWLELLLRQAAIYVAVLFLPLGFMAMVWPATSHWLRRLAQGLVAIILSKFVIVAVMALAASALNADVAEDGFSVVVAGGSMLSLAALAPYVLLRLIPVFDAELSSHLEGTLRRPTAAVGNPAANGRMAGMLRQHAAGAGGARAASGSAATAGSVSGAAGSGAATSVAAGVPVVAAGVAGARAATNGARRTAEQIADAPASSNGNRRAAPTRRTSTGTDEGGRASSNGTGREGST